MNQFTPTRPRLNSRPRHTDVPPPNTWADDYGRDPVEGELVQIDRERLALVREDPSIGTVAVHFPRLGYDIREV